MIKLSILIVVMLVAVVSFYGGIRWQKAHIGELRKWRLVQPLELQESPEHRGSLPVGTVLYEYQMLPETGSYIVFIKTQQRDVLEEYEAEDGRKNVIDPLSGYLAEHDDSDD